MVRAMRTNASVTARTATAMIAYPTSGVHNIACAKLPPIDAGSSQAVPATSAAQAPSHPRALAIA
jgi:hypothetical protein